MTSRFRSSLATVHYFAGMFLEFGVPPPMPYPCKPDMNQHGNADQDDLAALINAVAGGGCP